MAKNFSHLSDEELMVLYQKGDELAFEAIYSRHKNKVYSYLSKRLHNKDELEDLFQRVFIKFHKSRSLYNNKYDLLPWIYTITKSEFLDYIKKPKHHYEQINEAHLVTNPKDNLEKEIDIDAEKSLNENEKKALNLRYYSDQDFAEIARRLKTSQSNTRKIISRGLKKLRLKYLDGSNE